MWILRLSNIKIKNEDNNSGCESLAAGQRKQSVGNVGRNIEGRNAEERYLLGKDAWIDFIFQFHFNRCLFWLLSTTTRRVSVLLVCFEFESESD